MQRPHTVFTGPRVMLPLRFGVVVGLIGCTPPTVRVEPLQPVEAIITLGSRSEREHLFAVRPPAPVRWMSSPTLAVQAHTAGGYAVTGAVDSTSRPVVFIVQYRQVGIDLLTVGAVEVGFRTRLTGAAGTSVPTRPCMGGHWLSAFFVEGIGPIPTAPAVVHYRAGETLYTLELDPSRDVTKHPISTAPAGRPSATRFGQDMEGRR